MARRRRAYEKGVRQFFAWVFGDSTLAERHKRGVPLSKEDEARKDRLVRDYAKRFVARAKGEPEWGRGTIEAFLKEQKDRAERHEIEASTIKNYRNPLRLFCIMNDIPVNWEKLNKKLPKGREAADDRPPTVEEVKKILRFVDPRIRLIVLVMISSGIRIGSWDYMRRGRISPIERDGKVVAARLNAYNKGPWEMVRHVHLT